MDSGLGPKSEMMETIQMEMDAKATEHRLNLDQSELEVAQRPETSEQYDLQVNILILQKHNDYQYEEMD